MRRFVAVIIFFITFVTSVYAELPAGFRIDSIEKSVRDFQLGQINLTLPLDYYISRAGVRFYGKRKQWADISSSKFNFDSDAPDEVVGDDLRNYIINENIDVIVSYRDSVAALVTHTDGEGLYLLNYCWIEDGRWVNGGQGLAESFDDAKNKLLVNLPIHYENLPRIAQINNLPTDLSPFVQYLSQVQTTPEHFLLEMLRSHRLVINGEYHRRKVSWDMLKRLISLPEFSEVTSTVFMELPSWCQPQIDEFLKSDTLKTELILNIFREEQPIGWWDRGEFEFICELWRLNRSLPHDRRIKIVLADYQIPYSNVTERKDFKEVEDRNTHMANIVASTIQSDNDNRNSLFLVGCAHAYKSRQAGFSSSAYGQEAALTAGAQLAEILGNENVYTVFQHVMSGDNLGNNKSFIRGGVFDKAFELNGNKPLGFNLSDSPFGNEPFDGIYEIKYNISTGKYSDNFDGYLFLHPIATEPKAEPLTEVFSSEFVEEIKRRAYVIGNQNIRQIWFGKTADELTPEYICRILNDDN